MEASPDALPAQSIFHQERRRQELRGHQQSQTPHLATTGACQPGWGSPWAADESLPGKRRLAGEPSPALEAEGSQKWAGVRNPRMPEWDEAERTSEDRAAQAPEHLEGTFGNYL